MSEHALAPHLHQGIYPPAGSGDVNACEALVSMALAGAIIGGSAAAARNALRVKRDEIELAEALLSTGRTAIASAAATAVAGAAANAVTSHGTLRLSLMFGVGAAMLYGFSHWVEGRELTDV